MHANVHGAMGPHDVSTAARPASNACEHLIGLTLDDSVENELTTALAFGARTLARRDVRALLHALCDRRFWLRPHARSRNEQDGQQRGNAFRHGGVERKDRAHAEDGLTLPFERDELHPFRLAAVTGNFAPLSIERRKEGITLVPGMYSR